MARKKLLCKVVLGENCHAGSMNLIIKPDKGDGSIGFIYLSPLIDRKTCETEDHVDIYQLLIDENGKLILW